VYQTTVFASRSALVLGARPLPARWLPAPAAVQACVLVLLAAQSARGALGGGAPAFFLVLALVGLEGVCGGLA
jgi:battenin